jgi:uncharacterized protein
MEGGEASPFLVARWRELAMLNYALDPGVLRDLVPDGCELDLFEGRCFVSVVGFMFLDVRVRGMAVPFHTRFEEVNLRFYVRRDAGGERRRGVVFVRELVPLHAVAFVARQVYGERYSALRMRHRWGPGEVAYEWRLDGRWQGLRLEPDGEPALPAAGSEEQFITDHYWGYARGRRGTVEYEVRHPRWAVRRARSVRLDCDVERLYGPAFTAALGADPTSSFLAEGSEVAVMPGRPPA